MPTHKKRPAGGGKVRGRMEQGSGAGTPGPEGPGTEPQGGSARSVTLGKLLSDHKPHNGEDNSTYLTGLW